MHSVGAEWNGARPTGETHERGVGVGENPLDGYARTIILAERRVEHRCLILQSVYAYVPSASRPTTIQLCLV